MGCGVCGAFPFIAGMSTTMANMESYIPPLLFLFVILSVFLFSEKISLNRIVGPYNLFDRSYHHNYKR